MSCDLLQGCSRFCCEPIRKLVNTEIMSPFIEITMIKGSNKITVGNESMPSRRNHAAVKSLKFGHGAGGGSGGLAAVVEITDEAGGNFATFIDHVASILNPKKIDENNSF